MDVVRRVDTATKPLFLDDLFRNDLLRWLIGFVIRVAGWRPLDAGNYVHVYGRKTTG